MIDNNAQRTEPELLHVFAILERVINLTEGELLRMKGQSFTQLAVNSRNTLHDCVD